LPALVAALLSMRAGSQQAMLDEFYASLLGESGLVRAVSDLPSRRRASGFICRR